MRPYIAITGITKPDQVEALEIPTFAGHDVMLGILVSHKSISGQGASKRYADFHMNATKIVAAIESLGRKDVLPAVHYNSRSKKNVDEDLTSLWRFKKMHIQLNIREPELVKYAISALLGSPYSDWGVIFQANLSIVRQYGILGALAFFNGANPVGQKDTHVLFDLSGGRGEPLDMEKAKEAKEIAKKRFPKIGFGIAGGLTPDSVQEIISAIGTDVSIDVESGVRDADDQLVIEKANLYLANAQKALDGGSNERTEIHRNRGNRGGNRKDPSRRKSRANHRHRNKDDKRRT